jgi:SAM-dependent methyltransferase
MIFSFKKETVGKEENFAVCWTAGTPCDYVFSRRITRVLSRDGKELSFHGNEISIDSSPKYIFFEKMGTVPIYFKKHEVEEYERKRYRGADQRLVDRKEKRILHKILRRVVDKAGGNSIHALDIPCGYGRFSELLLDKGFNLTSSDLSFEMVKRAKEKSPVPAHLLAVAADAKKGLPFKNAKFDLVLSMRFFHHVHLSEERCAILKEFSRISAEWVILSFYKTNWLHSVQRKLRRMIKKSKTQIKMIPGKKFRREAQSAGLRIVKVYPLLKGIHSQHIALLRKI